MVGGFQYDITLGPYQQERLHAMTGAFVIHNSGDDRDAFSSILLWNLISRM